MNALYQKFGDVEVKDTIAAAKLMRDFKFVDKEKMCIFGWVSFYVYFKIKLVFYLSILSLLLENLCMCKIGQK